MSKMSKEKGKLGEREVAALLKEHGFEARRGQQFAGGGDSPDVVHNIPGIHIEVKRTEQFNLWAALDQAEQDKRPTEMPTVWHRKNGKKWVVVLAAQDFLKLVKESAQ
jgi:Holliday junction resolvase